MGVPFDQLLVKEVLGWKSAYDEVRCAALCCAALRCVL